MINTNDARTVLALARKNNCVIICRDEVEISYLKKYIKKEDLYPYEFVTVYFIKSGQVINSKYSNRTAIIYRVDEILRDYLNGGNPSVAACTFDRNTDYRVSWFSIFTEKVKKLFRRLING